MKFIRIPHTNELRWEDYRLTVITDRILRVEFDREDLFTDAPTQFALERGFGAPSFTLEENDGELTIRTAAAEFLFDKESGEVCLVRDGEYFYPSARTNLGGTARTLDNTNGRLRSWKRRERRDTLFRKSFGTGIFSSNGIALVRDGGSALIREDGEIEPRRPGLRDDYYFAFGDDYAGGLREYFSLTGPVPLLPKFVFGNWWSRYHAYTQDEYLALMDRFERENIPFTVAVIDMDWHPVDDVPDDVPKHGIWSRGWTGYTWNEKLFPDYRGFLDSLKDLGLRTALNLHPADGIRYFEKQYPEVAGALGIDPASREPAGFDLTDPAFRKAYFELVHRPYEEEGVDFWWIDWQQGTKGRSGDLDPLWLLNHYHYLDSCRNGRRGLILSRYAGLGSHRYPLGFSGDTVVSWRSLRFQPYFTSQAANAGYTWWSHDIGGHMFNLRHDPLLYLRWLQLGCFSPVMRLHSTQHDISKEPWNYPKAEKAAEEILRLRHRLIPYLFSFSVRTHLEGLPLCAPLYYFDSDAKAREKRFRNEYYFGEQMIVCPVTRRSGRQTLYLPRGEYFGFFDGKKYTGGVFALKSPFDSLPVFVKAGSVVPLLPPDCGNRLDFTRLTVRVYRGEGRYILYDDKGSVRFRLTKEEEGWLLRVDNHDPAVDEIAVEPVGFAEGELRVVSEDFEIEKR